MGVFNTHLRLKQVSASKLHLSVGTLMKPNTLYGMEFIVNKSELAALPMDYN